MYTDITKVSLMAKKHKDIDPNVIDTTSGVFFDENKVIGYSQTYDQLAKTLAPLYIYNYGAVSGGTKFQANIIRWLFDDIEFPEPPIAFATMGATGAISNTLDIYGKADNTILTTDLYWHNYELMAKTHQMKLSTFPLTENGKFNLQGLNKAVDELNAKEDRIIVILNQPAHNPTGYSLSEQEMQMVLDKLGSLEKDVILIYDIAYLDLAKERSHFHLLKAFKPNIKVVLAYSFSKSLGLYGVRLGASVLIGGTPNEKEEFLNQNYTISRTKWNSPNQEAVNTFNSIMSKSESISAVKQEIAKVKEELKLRSKYLIDFLNDNHIAYYPYRDGFFITIKTKNPNALFEQFQKQLIYPIVVNEGIRIAIATLPLAQIKELCERMKSINFHLE